MVESVRVRRVVGDEWGSWNEIPLLYTTVPRHYRTGLGIQRTPPILAPFSSTSDFNFRQRAVTSAFRTCVWTRTPLRSSRISVYWPGPVYCSPFISVSMHVRLCFLTCFRLDPSRLVAFFVTCIFIHLISFSERVSISTISTRHSLCASRT